MNRTLKLLVLSTLVLALPTGLLAAGGGLHVGASPQQSTSTLTVTIPGVVGIDIETDLTWDFTAYPAPNPTTCADDTFPPSPACTSINYYPNVETTTGGTPGPAPSDNAIYMSLFCNKNTGTIDVQAMVGAWNSGSPGFNTTDFQIQRDSANNAQSVGPATWSNLASSLTTIGAGNLNTLGRFPWTRADQLFRIYLPTVNTVTFNEGTYTTTATFQISKA